MHANGRTTGSPRVRALAGELSAGCVARTSQGSHMPPTSWGAGHRPPQRPDAPGPVGASKAFPLGNGATGPLPALPSLPPSLLPPPPFQLQSQGFQGCVSKGPSVLSFWHGALWPGMDIWSALTPTARASVAPRNSVARTAGTRERPRSPACLPSARTSLAKARLALPLPRGLPEDDLPPRGPVMPGLPLPGDVCSG